MPETSVRSCDKPLGECVVAIAGLGLMGGSLALALQGQVREVVGVARRRETLEQARRMGAIDRGETELAGAAGADVIVLATPVSVILRQLEEVGQLAREGRLRPGAVVVDMGSTKRTICRAMAELPEDIEPLGGHPMCGKEVSGLEVAEAGLYRQKPFAICPLARTAPGAVALVGALASAIGARPLLIDPVRHDWLVAGISHLPYAVALALFATADGAGRTDEMAWQLAASGFRSATRLAGSDDKMMADILLSNADAVLHQIEAFQANLSEIARLVQKGDEESLRLAAGTVRELRQRFLDTYGE
jgi:prephenate dehydrogenase